MAGAKSPKTLVDTLKKRKREVNESSPKSKRQRAVRKDNAANAQGRNASGGESNGQLVKANGDSTSAAVSSNVQESQLIKEFSNDEAGWRVSKPMGGRIMDIDPILTEDEQ
jgi:NET1-associated nuclear protein 1 (U3 small nucleolar RNA-associated protein 17)